LIQKKQKIKACSYTPKKITTQERNELGVTGSSSSTGFGYKPLRLKYGLPSNSVSLLLAMHDFFFTEIAARPDHGGLSIRLFKS